jgi:methyl-accepting chemotaxis protein
MDNMQAIERFSRLEASIALAAQACHRTAGTPQPLNDTLSQLEHQSQEVRKLMQQQLGEEAEDPARLFECADSLKSLGDQAAQLCDRADGLAGEVRDTVQEVQNEIAHFRRQLHGSENRREARPASRGAPH